MMDHAAKTDRALTAALRAVAEDEAGRTASPAVEARLLAEVRSIGATRRRRALVLLAAAAALLIAAVVPVSRIARRQPASVPATATPQNAAVTEVTTAFLPLAYSTAPITDGQLVRLEVPRAALASFGLGAVESSDFSSSETVLADVLVGEDGLARAVRFVRPSITMKHEEQQP
jgi:hypothetical protein